MLGCRVSPNSPALGAWKLLEAPVCTKLIGALGSSGILKNPCCFAAGYHASLYPGGGTFVPAVEP